jgi:hypothetical protein
MGKRASRSGRHICPRSPRPEEGTFFSVQGIVVLKNWMMANCGAVAIAYFLQAGIPTAKSING